MNTFEALTRLGALRMPTHLRRILARIHRP
jgi:hypothetical protein